MSDFLALGMRSEGVGTSLGYAEMRKGRTWQAKGTVNPKTLNSIKP